MPYTKKEQLPENVKSALSDVPHAQEIYKEAYNSAYDQYKNPEEIKGDKGREEVAHSVAWSAVKKDYSKDADGKWHPKDKS